MAAGEAIQCPTLLYTGHGEHRIEGIGDKHVPWIHNLRNTDVVTGIDDDACMALLRLFNEPAGRAYLEAQGVDPELLGGLDVMGISSIANLLICVKLARYFELGSRDVLVTVATDSMELYGSRISEERELHGSYTERDAAVHHERYLLGAGTDHVLELSYRDRKRMHNLKYFTWVEQLGKPVEELDAQWEDPDYWTSRLGVWAALDDRIREFNERTGLLSRYR